MSLASGVDIIKDGASRANLFITYPHSAVHRDIIARASKNFAAGTSTINILVKAPGPLQPHLEWNIIGSNDCEVNFYKAPTVATEGTDMTQTRLYLPSTKTTQMITKHGGTVDPKGTLLNEAYNGGGGTGAGVRGGASVHDDAEWVIELGTWYLIEIVRSTSGKVGVELEWYEVPEIKNP